MAKFAFEAKGPGGRVFKGEMEAGSENEVRIKLRAQRMFPTKVNQAEKKVAGVKAIGGKSISHKDLQIFTRQLATLLGSGIPILQSIETLAQSARAPALNVALKEIIRDITQGKRFGDAMAEHPKIFDRFYVNMVRAGEESGNIDTILTRLAQYIEKSVKIQGKVKGALIYPAVIMVVAGVVVAALLIFVIPKFETLFKSGNQELPMITQMVVGMSKFFVSYWYLIFGAIGAAVFFAASYYRTPEGREQCDRIFIDIPYFGDLIQKSGVARFTRTLATLLGSGVSIMEALDIAAKTTGNSVIEQALVRARESLTEGKSLTVPLAKEKYIPQMVTQMIGVGEQTGNMDTMLNKVADFYEDEVDVAVGALTAILEPMLMVVLGGIIAFLVVAMYLPIFNLAGAVS